MKKLIRWVLFAVLAVVALMVAAAATITVVVDPNEYKSEIARLVREKTNRELTFKGDIGFTFFPSVGLSVGPVPLGNAPGFQGPEMVRVQKAEISLRPGPLLSGKLAVGKVVLDGLSIHLVKNAQGVGSWEDLASGEASETEAEPVVENTPDESASDGSVLSLEDITVQGVEVINASLLYDDQEKRATTSVNDLRLMLGKIHGTDSVPFELSFDLKLDEPKLETRPALSGEFRLAPSAGTIALDKLQFAMLELRISGQLQAAFKGEHPTFSGDLRLAETSLRTLLTQFGVELPETGAPGNISAALRFTGTDSSVALEECRVTLANAALSARLQASTKGETPTFSGNVQLDETSLRRLLPALGVILPEMQDPEALDSFSASLRFSGTDNSVVLERCDMMLDGTSLTALGSVEDFAAPQISLTAGADEIDVDRYLPPRSDSKAAPTADVAAPADDQGQTAQVAQEPDLSALRGLDLDAYFEVGQLKAMNVTSSDIEIGIAAHDGVLTVSPLDLTLYDGRYEGKCSLDASDEVPAWTGKGALKGVQASPLLTELQGKASLRGTVSAEYDLHGNGLTPEGIKKTVSGAASFAVTDGAAIGIDVAKMIRDAWNQIKGTSVTGEEPGDFEFDKVSGSASLTKGRIVNKDLSIVSPLAKVSGAGWADLSKNTTEYAATVTVVGSKEGQESGIVEAVRDISLPVYIRGRLDQPDIGLDAKAMTQTLMTGVIEAGQDILLGDEDEDASSDDTDVEDASDSGEVGDAVINLIDGLI